MDYVQRCNAAPLARYFLCAAVAIMASGCGGDGGSGSSGTPAALTDTGPSTAQNVTPPSISGTPPTTVVAGNKYSFQPSVSDTSGDALTFSIENMPSWATFDTASGVLSGTPSTANVGSYQSISISVSNGKAIAQLAPFAIQVTAPSASTTTNPPNSPPTITGVPATSVQAGSHYAFQPSAADANPRARMLERLQTSSSALVTAQRVSRCRRSQSPSRRSRPLHPPTRRQR
jgi:hypothetical protein